ESGKLSAQSSEGDRIGVHVRACRDKYWGHDPADCLLRRAAQRMRAHRDRRRKGLRCIRVELRETEVDVLIRKGLLKPDARNDPCAIRDALHAHFDRTLDTAK